MADFGKLNFAVSFNPQTAFPLDARYYFYSLKLPPLPLLKSVVRTALIFMAKMFAS